MVTPEQIAHFRTFGFLHCKQFVTKEETAFLTGKLESAMRKARGGAEEPELTQDENGYSAIRHQVAVWDKNKTPFFDYDPESFYWMLDDERFDAYFRALQGEDYVVGVTEGIIHAGGTGWHNDHNEAYDDDFHSMRAHMYLDKLGPEDGCLTVLPGSNHRGGYRKTLLDSVGKINATNNSWQQFGVPPDKLPGAFPLINDPGDVIFLNHKTFHAALSNRTKRRCIHINVYKAARTDSQQEQIEALAKHIKSDSYEMHHSAAKALRRLGTPEALEIVAKYEAEGPERSIPWGTVPLW